MSHHIHWRKPRGEQLSRRTVRKRQTTIGGATDGRTHPLGRCVCLHPFCSHLFSSSFAACCPSPSFSFHGGWVAPNIYYLGFGGVVNFGGLRIGGLSGIFNERHVRQGHHEHAPFDNDAQRSVYHVREYDVWRLMQMRQDAAAAEPAPGTGAAPPAAAPFDIFLSHDWPRNIAHHGNTNELIRRKKFLASEIADGSLGSPPAETLLHALRPRYWFSAHLHVKFAAVVRHDQHKTQQQAEAATAAPADPAAPSVTQFLALDKCLPHREYMQLLEFPAARGPKVLCYDAHWLAVLKATHPLLSLQRQAKPIPQAPRPGQQAHGRWDYRPSEAELAWVRERVAAANAAAIAADPSLPPMGVPLNFVRTVPGWSQGQPTRAPPGGQLPFQINPQTSALLQMLQLPDLLTQAYARGGGGGGGGYGAYGQQGQGMFGGAAPHAQQPQQQQAHAYSPAAPASKKQRTDVDAPASTHNPDEIDLDDEGEGGCCAHNNPDEIAIDDEEPDDEGRLPAQAAAAAAPVAVPQPMSNANSDEINIDDM